MSGRWAARFRSITAYRDSVDSVDTVTITQSRHPASVSTLSIVSPLEKADAGFSEHQSVNTVNSVTDEENEIEAERDAIVNETAYATRQTIDQATMLRGLMAMASWR